MSESIEVGMEAGKFQNHFKLKIRPMIVCIPCKQKFLSIQI